MFVLLLVLSGVLVTLLLFDWIARFHSSAWRSAQAVESNDKQPLLKEQSVPIKLADAIDSADSERLISAEIPDYSETPVDIEPESKADRNSDFDGCYPIDRFTRKAETGIARIYIGDEVICYRCDSKLEAVCIAQKFAGHKGTMIGSNFDWRVLRQI